MKLGNIVQTQRCGMPADFVFKLFMVLCVLGMQLSWLAGLLMITGSSSPNYFDWEIEAQRKSIQRRMHDPIYRWQRVEPLDGELSIYTYCYYGYSLVNMALSHNHEHLSKEETLHELEELIGLAQSVSLKHPLDDYAKLRPAGGIIPTGNTNLLRAGYLILGGKDPQITDDFHQQSKELFDAFTASPVPFLESAPKMYWPIDNCAALESLRLHDALYATSYAGACTRATDFFESHLDPENGMMNIQVDKSGLRLDVPRGCGLSWQLALMDGFSPVLDQKQYALYRKNWFVPIAGMYGIREWWPGQQGYSLIPAGPVIADIGWAATGLGIGAAHINNDLHGWIGLLRGLELLGFPSLNLRGEKYYCAGLFLVADVMALWVKTNCIWDKSNSDYHEIWKTPTFTDRPAEWQFYCVIGGACLVAVFILFGLVQELQTSWNAFKMVPYKKWSKINKVMFVAQCFLAAIVFHEPVFCWPIVVLLMLSLKFGEQIFLAKVWNQPND